MKAIFKKELRSFFLSMTGYALIAFLITFVGIYFMIYNIGYGYPYFAYTLSGGDVDIAGTGAGHHHAFLC